MKFVIITPPATTPQNPGASATTAEKLLAHGISADILKLAPFGPCFTSLDPNLGHFTSQVVTYLGIERLIGISKLNEINGTGALEIVRGELARSGSWTSSELANDLWENKPVLLISPISVLDSLISRAIRDRGEEKVSATLACPEKLNRGFRVFFFDRTAHWLNLNE